MMTQAERDRLSSLKKAVEKLITQKQAAAEIGVTERQVRRLVKKWKGRGDLAVMHALRGKPSNRKLDEATRVRAMEILSQPVYRGFGPTLACEYLLSRHGVEVGRETLRKWMREAGLWRARRLKVKTVHQWRQRRDCLGELVQWDTSTHDWLEGRGERVYLISMIDDATSQLHARFVPHDSTAWNMRVLQSYLEQFGRPGAFYTDKAGLFQTAIKTKRDEQRLGKDQPEMPPTQIGRALSELGIVRIPAHSPQAKGRVERQFETAQDRLVKGPRVAGVCNLADANEYLDKEYLPWWNRTLTVPPANFCDAHRPLGKDHDLAAILSHVETRQINGYMIRFNTRLYKINRECIRAGMRKAAARVEVRLDGSVAVRFGDSYVGVTLCEQPAPPATSPERKTKPASPRKAPNAGGKSHWMRDFFQGPAISLKRAIRIANATG